jgi:flagellar protein FlaI
MCADYLADLIAQAKRKRMKVRPASPDIARAPSMPSTPQTPPQPEPKTAPQQPMEPQFRQELPKEPLFEKLGPRLAQSRQMTGPEASPDMQPYAEPQPPTPDTRIGPREITRAIGEPSEPKPAYRPPSTWQEPPTSMAPTKTETMTVTAPSKGPQYPERSVDEIQAGFSEAELKRKIAEIQESLKAGLKQIEKESPEVLKEKLTPEEKRKIAIEQKKLKSEVERAVEKSKEKILVEAYDEVKIYKMPDERLLYYYVPVPKPTMSERRIINTIKEAVTRLVSISAYRIRDPEQRRAIYKQKILDILQSTKEINIPKGKMEFYTDVVIREMIGYGLIDSLVRDDRLEEIMIIGARKPVYVFHRDYEMMVTNIEFYSEREIIDLINKIAREIGRRIDFAHPLLDARLPDGSRVNATIEPASVSGSTLTIRKFKRNPFSIVDMIRLGTLSVEVAAFLWLAVEGMGTRPANILIAGGTGSGKTTMLNVLASFIPRMERIITIEDTAELNLPLKHWIRLEARPPGLEGRGEITLDILTKNSLRMRPDRIIVGEIRHNEAFTLFTAMNTGHDGSMGTVHANSAKETLVRVTNPPMNVPETMLSGLDFIMVEHRIHDRKKGTIRRVSEIAEVTGVLEGKPQIQVIYQRNAAKDTLERTGVPCTYLRTLATLAGTEPAKIDEELEERRNFLEKLVAEDIRDIEETAERMEKFLLEKAKK